MAMILLVIFLPLPTTASGSAKYETLGSSGTATAAGITGIMVAKSMEFTYQELAKATNNFSLVLN